MKYQRDGNPHHNEGSFQAILHHSGRSIFPVDDQC